MRTNKKHLAQFARWTDDQLRMSYRTLDARRVKTGKNKGCVTVAALRHERYLVAEATRRGAEYPHNWLAEPTLLTQPTIFETLTAKLGREPSNAECKEDVFRILREVRVG